MQRRPIEGKKAELAQAVVRAAYCEGDFTLRSGAKSKYYFDKYQFEAQPLLLHGLARQIATERELWYRGGDSYEYRRSTVLAGLELGGVPLAVMLADHLWFPICFVRKQAKDYGTCRIAEGADVKGRFVYLVEDVITTGGQVKESMEQLEKLGAVIAGVLCVIDRSSPDSLYPERTVAQATFQGLGVPLYSLFQYRELEAFIPRQA